MPQKMLDISGYQAGLPMAVYRQADAVVIKATEGTGYTNPAYSEQVSRATGAGKPIGVYHFATPGDSDEQVDYFLSVAGPAIADGATPVLDWEDPPVLDYPNFARDFMAQVQSKTGRTPVLYAGPSTAARADHAELNKYPLWLACYPYSTAQNGFGAQATLDWAKSLGGGLPGWNIWAWQYTGTGRLDGWGGDLDMSDLYGSIGGNGGSPVRTVRRGDVDPMILPCDGKISQGYGHGVISADGGTGFHTGVDFAVPRGSSFAAPYKGTVLYAGSAAGFTGIVEQWLVTSGGGNIVVLGHDGWNDLVYHLDEVHVTTGQTVATGTILGLVGSTGNSTGPHAHWDVIPDGTDWDGYQPPYGRVDPLKFREDFNNQTITTTTGDWLDMASKQDVKDAVREVLKESIKREGAGQNGTTSIWADAAWKDYNLDDIRRRQTGIARMVRDLWATFRVGIPGVQTDGALGAGIRKVFGYNEGAQGNARKTDFQQAARKDFSA